MIVHGIWIKLTLTIGRLLLYASWTLNHVWIKHELRTGVDYQKAASQNAKKQLPGCLLSITVRKVSCIKESWHGNFIYENEISLHESEISMYEFSMHEKEIPM